MWRKTCLRRASAASTLVHLQCSYYILAFWQVLDVEKDATVEVVGSFDIRFSGHILHTLQIGVLLYPLAAFRQVLDVE